MRALKKLSIAAFLLGVTSLGLWVYEGYLASTYVEAGCKAMEASKGCLILIKSYSGVGFVSPEQARTLTGLSMLAVFIFAIGAALSLLSAPINQHIEP